MKTSTLSKPGVNYYALLGITSTATQDEVTKAFRKKILQVHLDKMGPEDDTSLCYATIEAHRILSDKALRAKYDVERSSSKDKSEEVFIPAGYICYDVGHQQMSRQLLDSISTWTSEYDKVELSDNYFHCFSQLVSDVMCDNGGERSWSNVESYYCPVCEKNYVTETHHWDSVINPYRAMFFSDVEGVAALRSYCQELTGVKLFNWELRYLPSRLLGIWGSPDWSMLTVLHHETSKLLKECKYSTSSSDGDISSIISRLDSLPSKRGHGGSFFTSRNRFLQRSLIQNLIWVLENKGQVEQMMSRMGELICQDDVQEILCLGMSMRNVLGFQQSEWEQLIQEALKEEQFEVAMMWTKLAVESGDKRKSDWFELGMTLRSCDPVLAHFCFLLSGCESGESWEELANIFTQNGAHYAAIEYHLNRGNLLQLLHKSRALKEVDPEGAKIYSGIYNATRIKGLLQILSKRSRQSSSEINSSHNEELEELIEIIQDLASSSNLMEGFRLIISTWPDVFEEAPGYWIHRATIQFLRRGRINLKSAKLILAAAHFLPELERLDEIGTVSEEASELTRELLERALETNEFELLTDVLLHLNKRTLATAERYLEEINPPPAQNPDEAEESEEKAEKEQETPQPPPQNTAPGHKSAMVLLLSGTIHKVREEWLGAMKDYQNALLSAPECMHRVLPCVSKLVQDIQFHEAVVSQVHREIEVLQSHLSTGTYPDIDTYSSDTQGPSLLLTDVAPKMDYGYKDCVAKLQPDPDKIPGPPPEDEEDAPPPPPANTPMVTLDKNEEAIQTGQSAGQMDQLSAALSYVDLLKALPLQMHPGPLVMASSHFLRAMDETEEVGKLYAYRNAIMMMAENLLRVDRKFQATIHHGLTHKHMLSILLSAHEKLSKAFAAKKCDHSDDVDDREKPSLIKKADASVISKFLSNVVNFPKVEPLASIPTLNCSDLVYVETLGNSFLSHFCADKVRQKHQSPLIPKHLHAYTHFVEVWKGRSTLSDFPQARVKAMEELLALKGWSMGDVERKMSWPFLTLQDGFSPPLQCLLQLRDPLHSYRSVDGFHIDYENGQVSLLLSRDTLNPVDTLFDVNDIRDVVALHRTGFMEKMVFSLEPADGTLSSHPFKEGKITLKGLQHKSHLVSQQRIWSQIPENIGATLSRVSLLLCYLASGLELSSETPFWMRRTDEGLLQRLDDHLQHFARPVSWRKAERRAREEKTVEMETIHKFWLNMVEVFEEIEEEEGSVGSRNDEHFILPQGHLTYRVGNLRTEVRPNTLVMTLDPTRKTQRLSAEAEFARDLTRHYEEIGRAFPELLRIQELVKMSVVCSKLKQVLSENKGLLQEAQNGRKRDVKAVSKVCAVIEEFLGCQTEEEGSRMCNWFPATFCHNMDNDPYDVSAGVELDPVVTYGPVPPAVNPIVVPLARIIYSKEQLLEMERNEETVIDSSEEEEEVEEEEEGSQCEEMTEEGLSDVPEEEEEESGDEVTDHDFENADVEKVAEIRTVGEVKGRDSSEAEGSESEEEEDEEESEGILEEAGDTEDNVSDSELDNDCLEEDEEKVDEGQCEEEEENEEIECEVENEEETECEDEKEEEIECEEDKVVTIVIKRRSLIFDENVDTIIVNPEESSVDNESLEDEDEEVGVDDAEIADNGKDEVDEDESEAGCETDEGEASEEDQDWENDGDQEAGVTNGEECTGDEDEEFYEAETNEGSEKEESEGDDDLEAPSKDQAKNRLNGTSQNSGVIDGKFSIQLRKAPASGEALPVDNKVTKRSFLSRRGRVVMEEVRPTDKSSESDNCSEEECEEEQLILSQ